jgi:integral membrane protein (TIGR01906 family)
VFSEPLHSKATFTLQLVIWVLARIISFLIPVLLLLLSVRVVLTEAYLKLEYNRPGFPADRYGWDESVRLEYGPYGVRYLLNDESIAYLGRLEIDGEPAFTPSELDHMEDVKVVTRTAMRVLTISLIVFLICVGLLAYHPVSRPDLLRAIARGGWTTLGIIVLLLLTMGISWDFFFDSFHALFFEAGTWQFYTSDTLIRLYPQQFWFDSALVVGVLTLSGALLCIWLPRYLSRKAHQDEMPLIQDDDASADTG